MTSIEKEIEKVRKRRNEMEKNKRQKIRERIVAELASRDISSIRGAVYTANEHSMLDIIPIEYLEKFVEDVLIKEERGEDTHEDMEIAYRIRNFGKFSNTLKLKTEKFYVRYRERKKINQWVPEFAGGS